MSSATEEDVELRDLVAKVLGEIAAVITVSLETINLMFRFIFLTVSIQFFFVYPDSTVT